MKHFFMTILIVAAALATACDDDPAQPKDQDPNPYHSLTSRTDILFNLQKLYNDRNTDRLDELMDAGFVFFLSDGDVNGGGLPPQWDRATDMEIHEHMFDRDGSPGFPVVTRFEMDLRFEEGVTWTPIVPSSAPAETWYTTTIFYDFIMDVEPDTKYIPAAGAKLQATVRNVGSEESPSWRLVELRDLGGANLKNAELAAATEESTLGKVKALYRD